MLKVPIRELYSFLLDCISCDCEMKSMIWFKVAFHPRDFALVRKPYYSNLANVIFAVHLSSYVMLNNEVYIYHCSFNTARQAYLKVNVLTA